MLKQLPILIEDNLDGTYFILFSFNGKITKGKIPSDLVPIDYESLSVELTDYFQSWYDYLNQTINPTIKEEIKIKEKEKLFIEGLDKCTLLTCIDNKYYRLNNTISLPEVLVQEYVVNQYDTEFISKLDAFWYWNCYNEYHIKEMLYNWMNKSTFQLTQDGMILCYRNVIKCSESELDRFVKESVIKIKKWRKNIKDYFVNQGEVLSLTRQKTSINLFEHSQNIKIKYTHKYNSSLRHYYYLNEEATIDRSFCDTTDVSCSKGFHVTSKEFVEQNGQSYFGNITIACLVNPSNVIACPTESNYAKMRVCAFYPICEVEWIDGKIVEPLKSIIEKATKKYTKNSIVDLQKFIFENFEDNNPKFIGLKKEIFREIILFK